MERQALRNHLSGSVPISIAVHVVVVLLVVIIPLTAVDPSMIVVPSRLPEYIRAIPIPPPPPVAIRTAPRVPTTAPRADVNLAPITVPSSIVPETEARVQSDISIPGPPGASADLGAIDHIGQPIAVRPPEPPHPAGPVRVGELPVPPRKTVDVRPIYPEIARAAHVEGIVVMEAVLDPRGSVTQLRVVRSMPLLDQAAMDAVRQWKYTPSVYGGHPVSVLMTITIRFTLQQ